MPRLAVARLWFCSNSFTPRRTRSEDVKAHEWSSGAAAFATPAHTAPELDGVRGFLATRPDWNATVLRCASAPPSGPLSAEMFGAWMADVEDALRRSRFDGIYLSLHGACQAEGDPAADVTILRRLRALVGHTPMVASFDLRANLAEETAILLDGASANRALPGDGGAMAAFRALSLLEGIITGRCRPVGALARVPMVLPDPFVHEALAELWHDDPSFRPERVLDASVFGGFAWGDSPYSGPSALVWADRDAGLAREAAARLAVQLARWRTRLSPKLSAPEPVLETLQQGTGRLARTVLLDPSDDPGAGALADTPELLRALVAASTAGRITGPIAFAGLHDAETVAAACAAGPGQTVERSLGGRTTSLYGAPLRLELGVRALVDTEEAGLCAVLRHGEIDVLVMSRRPASILPPLLEATGLMRQGYRLIAVKGGQSARVAFTAATNTVLACECPGPAGSDLMRLPFHYVPANRRLSAQSDADDVSAFATRSAPRSRGRARGIEPAETDSADPSHEQRRIDPQTFVMPGA